ncbi:hypothetical protein OUZ56_001416 [Daphnia magna]|uniref:Uncharacterized protein n=1 Tax=Daphnia magna TaxID=35525 RepID=A0ABR0A2L7_9CRUS|nr:hypothetical protein OUZ56_001416 [Daphnia magna]
MKIVIRLQIFIFRQYKTAVSTISLVSPPVDHTQLHFLGLPVLVVYAFGSSRSSSTSSPHHCLRRRLRLHLHLVDVLAVFAFVSSPSSPSLSTPSPRRLRPLLREFIVDRRPALGTGRNGLRRKAPKAMHQ